MKKKNIILIVIVCLLGIGFLAYNRVSTPREELENRKTYVPVTIGTIDKKIVVAGKVKLTNEQKLRFNVTGRVTKVNFLVGDKIEKGQIIAELDKSELNNNIRKDQIALESATRKRDNVLNKNENLEIEKGKNSLEKAENDLKIAEKELTELNTKQLVDAKQAETAYQKKLSEVSDLEKKVSDLTKKVEELDQRVKVAVDLEEQQRLGGELESAKKDLDAAKKEIDIAKKDASDLYEKKPLDALQQDVEKTRKENSIKEFKKSIEEQKDALREAKKKSAREEEIREASNSVELQQLALHQSKTDLNKYELVAPFSGILTKIDFKIGDNLIADEQKFANMKNPEVLTVVTSLDQREVVQASIGQKAIVTFSALPGKVFSGEIVELEESPKENDTSGATSYEAVIAIDKQGEKLYSGMTAKVEIGVSKKENVLTIPLLAVRDEDGEPNKFVWVKGTEAEDERRAVVIGLTDQVNAEVISGLEEGEEVLEADLAQMESDFGGEAKMEAETTM